MIFPVTNIITLGDRHWIYYGGNNERHGCAEKDIWFGREGSIGLAHLRRDGFVALEAGRAPGTLTTRPFVLAGSTLELNVDASAGGTVCVELLDQAGTPIAGYSGSASITEAGIDNVRFRPRWAEQADLSAIVGETVRLKCTLQQARLYAFQFQE